MRKAFCLIISCLVIGLMFPVNSIGETSSLDEMYTQAQVLLVQGDYSEAAAIFDALGVYSDSSQMAMYCKAIAMAEVYGGAGYLLAVDAFNDLGDFKDSKQMSKYYLGRSYEATGDLIDITIAKDHELKNAYDSYSNAVDVFFDLALFKDSFIRMSNCSEKQDAIVEEQTRRKEEAEIQAYQSAFDIIGEWHYYDDAGRDYYIHVKDVTEYSVTLKYSFVNPDNTYNWAIKESNEYETLIFKQYENEYTGIDKNRYYSELSTGSEDNLWLYTENTSIDINLYGKGFYYNGYLLNRENASEAPIIQRNLMNSTLSYDELSEKEISKDIKTVADFLKYTDKPVSEIKKKFKFYEDDSDYTNGYGKLKLKGKLFEIDGDFEFLYKKEDNTLNSLMFTWQFDDFHAINNYVIGCISQYFGDEYEYADYTVRSKKLSYAYDWYDTTKERWSVHYVIGNESASISFNKLRSSK